MVVHLVEGIHISCRFRAIPLIGHNRAGDVEGIWGRKISQKCLAREKETGWKETEDAFVPTKSPESTNFCR